MTAEAGWLSIEGMLIMALHDRDTIRDQLEDCVFADPAAIDTQEDAMRPTAAAGAKLTSKPP